MNNQTERLRFLLGLYAENQANEKQVQEMLALLKTTGNSAVLENFILELKDGAHEKHDVDWNKVWSEIELATSPSATVHEMQQGGNVRSLWKRIAVAASVILVIGIGSYFMFFNKTAKQPEVAKTNVPHDVEAPKVTKATITLADGRKVTLDSVTSGTLAIQGTVNVVKNANGEIVYNGASTEVVYNTLYNPRGSKVQSLTLSDGTKVWLNSESSLKYPVAFTGNERRVEITGEAYFEVTHDAKKKFVVAANGVLIEDLGTEFNVNSYEVTKTTLINGVVRVGNIVLKPGEQTENEKLAGDVDIQEVVAWKNGKFQFNDASIETIMKEVSRWYDAEIVYEGKIPGNFVAGISRDVSVSKLLHILELTNRVHFRIEGKKVIVTP